MPPLHFQRDASGKDRLAGALVRGLGSAFGTPLYALDEDDIRESAAALVAANGNGSVAFTASALCVGRMLHLADEAGLLLSLNTPGELEYALRIGFPRERMIIHGLSHSAASLRLAASEGVGHLVLHDLRDMPRLEAAAADAGRVVSVLLSLRAQVHPGDPLCEAALWGIPADRLLEAAKAALDSPHLMLSGLHAAVAGVPDAKGYAATLAALLSASGQVYEECGYAPELIHLSDSAPAPEGSGQPEALMQELLPALRQFARACGVDAPRLTIETGRGIVARAGVVLFRILSVREGIDGRRLLVVDGGGAVLPPHANATFAVADRSAEPAPCDIIGSGGGPGDLLAGNVLLPLAQEGDLLIAFSAGAYAQSMASSAGRMGTPPLVFVREGIARPATRRDVLADWLRLESGL